ncbi:MAG: type II toxin-antitoxin system RelE/ParE family toxin [Saprospiraceae bacterium]|nr:type II toxin-antitoxin system RelE/ParE family toxin [Saprospiraceae bacterium]
MKLKYELSQLALKDAESIWQYTAEKWSVKQANIYYKQIFEEIDFICKNPLCGKSIKEIKEQHRSKFVNVHMIIYKVHENKILIDRILHQKMDIDNQVNE